MSAYDPLDTRLDDENFILCMVLTFIGLPPSIWRTIVSTMLTCLSMEYWSRYDDQKASAELKDYKVQFAAWGALNKLKAALVFLAESKVAFVTIENAAAVALRTRLLAMLAARGVSAGMIATASQMVRKVAIYLEIAYVTGCATYCGSKVLALVLQQFARGAADAANDASETLQSLGSQLGTGIARVLLIAKATLDPSNWNTSATPNASMSLMMLQQSIWSQLKPDDPDAFVSNLAKPISSFSVPLVVLNEIAAKITATINARGGVQKAVLMTPDFLRGLTPLAFAETLKEWGLISFKKQPEQAAELQTTPQG